MLLEQSSELAVAHDCADVLLAELENHFLDCNQSFASHFIVGVIGIVKVLHLPAELRHIVL